MIGSEYWRRFLQDDEPAIELACERLQDAYRTCHPTAPGYTWLRNNPKEFEAAQSKRMFPCQLGEVPARLVVPTPALVPPICEAHGTNPIIVIPSACQLRLASRPAGQGLPAGNRREFQRLYLTSSHISGQSSSVDLC